jgi:RNA polymerase sigma factor (sigma-70 family)
MADEGMPMTRSADELAAAALAGEGVAWNALVKRHDRRVVVTLLAMGLPLHQAKEIAQETWLRLLEQQRKGKLTRLDLPGLAIAQARFLALDARRREAPVAEPVELIDGAASTERELLTRQDLTRAARALEGCGETAKRLFQLVYGAAGLSHREAARRVGISPQRAKQSLCEVRAKLRAAMEDDHE